MSTTATYYVVSKLTNFTSEMPGYPVEMKLPAGCVGSFLVFETLDAALDWAAGEVETIRPVRITRCGGEHP